MTRPASPDDHPLPRHARRITGEPLLQPLTSWRAEPAYVLLGDPGAGKSTSFKAEALAQGAALVEASDIVDGVEGVEGWRDRIVFIDGLDQIKANGRAQGLGALGSIRAWLAKARPAGFRLSCREADWLGAAEQDALARVSLDGQVTVLQLEPLSQDEALVLLQRREAEIGDAVAFWQAAEERQMTALFGNPLLLDLMVDAVAERGGQWPHTRWEVYEAACERLVRETSKVHLAARPAKAGYHAELLNTAGLLCALLLLSGKSAVVPRHATTSTLALEDLPPELALSEAAAALATKVFIAPAGQPQPRHRSIAEYLAARALARRLDDGLPLGRVLALILGFDGQPVEALRGLLAWLVAAHMPSRSQLLRLDPLGFVLNGDPARLSTTQRLELLQALAEQAAANPWFRRDAWQSHPFGALLTTDMAEDIRAILCRPQRDRGHQAFVDCLLDALLHCDLMPSLAPALAGWVADPLADEGNRVIALRGWQRHCPAPEQAAQERAWLDAMKQGQFPDPSSRLSGELLCEAYPGRVGPAEVLDYLKLRRDRRQLDGYDSFWELHFLSKTRPGDAATLVERWLQLFPACEAEPGHDELRSLSGKLLARALTESGDQLSDDRLYEWLEIGLDKYGIHTPAPDSLAEVLAWLSARPDRIYAVLKIGYDQALPEGPSAQRSFWRAEERLLGAQLPRDHLDRLLRDVCGPTHDPEVARHVLIQVIWAVMKPGDQFEVPSLESLSAWATEHHTDAMPYLEWLSELTTWPLDHWQGNQHRRNQEYRRKQGEQRVEHHQSWSIALSTVDGPLPDIWLVHQVAKLMRGRSSGLQGEPVEDKVQDLLGVDMAGARTVMAAVYRTLTRSDLPQGAEILALAKEERREYLLSLPALVAANQACVVDRSAPLGWSEPLCETLVAAHLVSGHGERPYWYRLLAQERPEIVASVLMDHVQPPLANPVVISMLGVLFHEDGHEAVTARVLPEVLRRFPKRVSAEVRRSLDGDLLSALTRLPSAQASTLIAEMLSDASLSPRVRLSWLVADLRYRATAIDDIHACVASSRPRRLALAEALYRQGVLSAEALPNEAQTLKVLIATLAPHTKQRDRTSGARWVGPAEKREDLVRAMFNRLAQMPSSVAADALQELVSAVLPHDWRWVADYSRQAQRSTARQSRFEIASPNAVALTLANKAPAHQADLRALLLDHLHTISQELRGSNSFALSQFWNDQPVPRDENECRNLLLEKLRVKLQPLGVLVEPEVAAADLKRMDMKLTFTVPGRVALSLPVEAKKDSHKDLWTAWREQLQRLYTIDPRAGGYGVYLVFWFGHKTQRPPGGDTPDSAEQLRRALEAELDERARQLIAIYVLDLSWSRVA